jgi:hypothetical protein
VIYLHSYFHKVWVGLPILVLDCNIEYIINVSSSCARYPSNHPLHLLHEHYPELHYLHPDGSAYNSLPQLLVDLQGFLLGTGLFKP